MSIFSQRQFRFLAIFVASATSAAAHAGIVHIQADTSASTEGLGNFSGSLQWAYAGGATGILTVSLTNTSDVANGGYITAFAFNSDASAPSFSLDAASNGAFGLITGVNAMPYGMNFLAGASTGGSFQGGGNPTVGIGVGQTGTFVFSVSAGNLGDLGASNFIAGPYAQNFVVRFRGFDDGGSDKVPGSPFETPVPAPGAIALLGVAGLLGARRRRDA